MVNICKNCKYWQYEDVDKGHVCVNDESVHLAEWMQETDNCKVFVGKDNDEINSK